MLVKIIVKIYVLIGFCLCNMIFVVLFVNVLNGICILQNFFIFIIFIKEKIYKNGKSFVYWVKVYIKV